MRSLPPDQRKALESLRKTIRAAASTAVEGFSYGLPAFRLEGRPLVCYQASRNHCSFYPMSPAVIQAHTRELKGYDQSKGTIRFTPSKPLPASLIRKLVRARMVELRKPKA
ncbi:MAG TPA: DUF1801 domain-containing protein [Anaerolineales bacterium]|nr:DUF1801 domain-containing protein [Anaerolineales bacterium]